MLVRHVLPEYDPMTIRGRDDDLPHPICRTGWQRACSTTGHQRGVERIDIINTHIAEPLRLNRNGAGRSGSFSDIPSYPRQVCSCASRALKTICCDFSV